jgi:hypothetical protein
MKIKKFNENSEGELPKSIDVDIYLDQIKILQSNMEGKLGTSEWNSYVELISLIDDIIKDKLQSTLDKYLENSDYEGAKWFVGRSYKDVLTAGKTLLFRHILLHEKERFGKYNL